MFICGYWIFGRKFGWQVNLDFYSGALNSVPSLLCAISLLYYFKNLNIGSNKIINTLAASSLGIYIIHQVPLFYPVLWNQIKSSKHAIFPIINSIFDYCDYGGIYAWIFYRLY